MFRQAVFHYHDQHMEQEQMIGVEAMVKAPMERVWSVWTEPAHIMQWAFASADWEAPEAENDLRVGGNFRTRMQAKDGSAGFDFTGTYTTVKMHELIEYEMEGGRKVRVEFAELPWGVRVAETFDPEAENTREMQKAGWQAILDNFKKYAEREK